MARAKRTASTRSRPRASQLEPSSSSGQSLKSSLLFTLPLELRLQILRYLIPHRQYFLIRQPRTIAFRTEGVQRLLHEPIPERLRSDKWCVKLVDETEDPYFDLRLHKDEPPSPQQERVRLRRAWLVQRAREKIEKNEQPVILTGPRTLPPPTWLPLLKVSRQFQKDCYKILYEENRFIFHIGSPGSCTRDACITSEPFCNTIQPIANKGRPSFLGTLRHIAKLHLDVKICMETEERPAEGQDENAPALSSALDTPRPDPMRVSSHQTLLESWIIGISLSLLHRDTPPHEFSLRVKHYRPATASFKNTYTQNVPEGVPYHMDLDTWQAKHRGWTDFNLQAPAGEGYPVPEVFSSLKLVNGINRASVSGLDPKENRALEKAMMKDANTASKSTAEKRGPDRSETSNESSVDAQGVKRLCVEDTRSTDRWNWSFPTQMSEQERVRQWRNQDLEGLGLIPLSQLEDESHRSREPSPES